MFQKKDKELAITNLCHLFSYPLITQEAKILWVREKFIWTGVN